jgi:hypothetical protein
MNNAVNANNANSAVNRNRKLKTENRKLKTDPKQLPDTQGCAKAQPYQYSHSH